MSNQSECDQEWGRKGGHNYRGHRQTIRMGFSDRKKTETTVESDPLAEEEGGSVRNAGQKLPLLSTEQLDMESSLSRTNNKPDNEILGRRKYLNELHKL